MKEMIGRVSAAIHELAATIGGAAGSRGVDKIVVRLPGPIFDGAVDIIDGRGPMDDTPRRPRNTFVLNRVRYERGD